MKYIDKEEHLEDGDNLSKRYLREAFREDECDFYPSTSVAYNDFRSKCVVDGVNQLEVILCGEQNGRCCYCMGRLERKEITLEHVIPQRIEGKEPQKEYEYYCGKVPLIGEHVVIASEFDHHSNIRKKEDIDNLDKIPHTISYVNLTASCMGKNPSNEHSCFCNERRGNKRIVPMMLMPDMEHRFQYLNNGRINVDYAGLNGTEKVDIVSTVEILNLNSKLLIDIRTIWCKFAENSITLDVSKTIMEESDRKKVLIHAFKNDVEKFVEGYRDSYKNFVTNDKYWKFMLRYDWFYDYYKRKNAIT